jgi:predicted dehydrogenase
MAEKFRVGIIGATSSYTLHYGQALQKMPKVELVGLAHLGRSPKYIKDSLNLPWLANYPKTLEGYAERFGAEIYERPEEMIDKGKLDGVCITTEDYLHQHHGLRAVEKGMHVFVPKPFARSRAEAETMFNAANERGVVLVGSLPHRFRPPSVTARKAIDEGFIGRPIAGHFAIAHHITLGGWKSDPTMAAGPEYEIGFYVFDLMRMMMKSEPKNVMGFGANLDHRGIPYIDNGKCIIECENGALASIDLICSMHQHFPAVPGMHVVGDEGALAVEKESETGQNVIAIYTPNGVERREIPNWNSVERELTTWIDICRADKDPSWWQEEGLRTLDLISAYKQAYQCGGMVTLNSCDAE